MSIEIKLCKDCKHFHFLWAPDRTPEESYFCLRWVEIIQEIDFVSGMPARKTTGDFFLCAKERSNQKDADCQCGEGARWFEPKSNTTGEG